MSTSRNSTRRLRRHAIARRRIERRRKLAGAGLALALLSAVPVTMAAITGHDVALPGAESARSILAMLKARSPGERTEGELVSTKRVVSAEIAPEPKQRALGKIRKPDVPDELAEAIAPAAEKAIEPLPPEVLFAEAPPIPSLTPVPPGGNFYVPPPGGGGGGGGGGGNPPPEEPPVNPPPPVPAVPEPGTWAMMLIGFGSIGWTLRRSKRRGLPAQLA